MNIRTVIDHICVTSLTVCILPAQERSQPPAVVVQQCSGCHAVNGDSQLPYVPRLAGLTAGYIESKLQMYRSAPTEQRDEFLGVFWRRARADDAKVTPAAAIHMVGVAKAISESDLKVVAEWYASQRPRPSTHHAQEVNSEGKTLFTQGIPAKSVAACESCHGRDGQGSEHAPRIAGQHGGYIRAQLQLFRDNARPSSPMTQIARSLPDDAARAVAKYLETR